MKQTLLIIGILLMIANVNATCPCSGNNPCNRTTIDYNDTHNLIIESTYLCGDVTGDGDITSSDVYYIYQKSVYPDFTLNCNPPTITYYFEQKMVNKSINLTTSYDGHVEHGMDYKLFDYQDSIIAGKQSFPMPSTFRAFAEFDISSIPKNANITNITFKYDGRRHYIDCNISNMTVQPINSTAQQIYTNIGTGTDYYNGTGFPVLGSNQSINLGLYAINDLQRDINDSNWFALGIYTNESLNHISDINASENVDSTPPPTLQIDYQVPAKPLREELNIMFHEYNMHINIMSNPLEYIVTKLDNKVGTNIIRPRRCKKDV